MLMEMRPPSSPADMSLRRSAFQTDMSLRRAPSPAELRRHAPSPSGVPACGRSSPSDLIRYCPVSPAELRRPRGLAAAGKSMVNLRPSTRPDSRESDGDDGGLGEAAWRKQQRDSIKKGSMRTASMPDSRPSTSDLGASLLRAPQELPPLRLRPAIDLEAKTAELEAKNDAELAAKRAKSDAQAQASACWEDLISFLELHKLPGAYALAFSAFGIEDLSSLLLLDDAGLSSLLERCSIDAMDEIMLLEALRTTRPFQ